MESEGGESNWLPFISIGLNWIDTFVIIFFTLEYLIRFGRSRTLLEIFCLLRIDIASWCNGNYKWAILHAA